MSVGENIKKYRKEKGLTQTELGKLIGKSLRMIQKYEAADDSENSVTPSFELLQKIADALDIPILKLVEDYPFEEHQYAIKFTEKRLAAFTSDLNRGNTILSSLLKELIANPNDENLIKKRITTEKKLELLKTLLIYTKREYDELLSTSIGDEGKQLPNKVISYVFTEEKDKSEEKVLLDKNEGNNSEILQKSLLSKFNKLNMKGKKEAIKRVDELTQISSYSKDENFTVNYDEIESK